jgi:natural product precursor
MKPKVFIKKLVLNKKTIADLNNKEMKDVVGGEPSFTYSNRTIVCIFTGCGC